MGSGDLRYLRGTVRDALVLARRVNGKLWPTLTGHIVRLQLFASLLLALIVLYGLQGAAVSVMAAVMLKNPSARSVMALLGWFPVRMYGAVPNNGLIDNQPMIQAAIAACASSANGGSVLIEQIYWVRSPVAVTTDGLDVKFDRSGDGGTFAAGLRAHSTFTGDYILKVGASGAPVEGASLINPLVNGFSTVTREEGYPVAGSIGGIYFASINGVLERPFVQYVSGNGIVVGGNAAVNRTFTIEPRIGQVGGDGFSWIEQAADNHLVGGIINLCRGRGIHSTARGNRCLGPHVALCLGEAYVTEAAENKLGGAARLVSCRGGVKMLGDTRNCHVGGNVSIRSGGDPGATTLAAAITTAPAAGTVETITITSYVSFPLSSALGSFVVTIGTEKLLVTAGHGTTSWTVTRGHLATTPATHPLAAVVDGTNVHDGLYDAVVIETGVTAEWGRAPFLGEIAYSSAGYARWRDLINITGPETINAVIGPYSVGYDSGSGSLPGPSAFTRNEVTDNGTNTLIHDGRTSYRTIVERGVLAAAAANGIRAMGALGAAPLTAGTNSTFVGAFYFDPARYARSGRSTKLMISWALATNDVAAGVDLVVSMRSISTPTGGAGVVTSAALGSAISGSSSTRTTPPANVREQLASGDFDPPAAGWYVLAIQTVGAMAASSAVAISARLNVRNT